MQSARKHLTWVIRHRKLLIKCWCLLVAVRVTLLFRGYKPILGWIERASPSRSRGLPVHLLVWAVETAARLVPGASCLTRALTLRFVLAQANENAEIQIGVRTDEKGAFKAHAWVTMNNELLANETLENIQRYKLIAAL